MIMSFRRMFPLLLLTLALAMSLVTAPVSTLPAAHAAYITDYSKLLTKGQKQDLAAAESIRKHAVNKAHNRLNYKTAKKYDKGDYVARRKMAAGFLSTGGKITNITSGELKKVKKYLPTKRRAANSRTLGDSPKRCTGVTKWKDTYVKGPAFQVDYYLNSCDTDFVKDASDSIAIALGIAAGIYPPSAPVVGLAAGIVLLTKTAVSNAQNRSDVDAIILRDYTHILWLYPQ
jgi:hypothetical protein